MAAVLNQEPVKALLSDDHFSVDGTLIEAWASMKSFRPKDGGGEPPAPGLNGERDFNGEKRSNETHASTSGHRPRHSQVRQEAVAAVLHDPAAVFGDLGLISSRRCAVWRSNLP